VKGVPNSKFVINYLDQQHLKLCQLGIKIKNRLPKMPTTCTIVGPVKRNYSIHLSFTKILA